VNPKNNIKGREISFILREILCRLSFFSSLDFLSFNHWCQIITKLKIFDLLGIFSVDISSKVLK